MCSAIQRRQGGVHGCGADLRFMQDSLGAAKGPRRGLIDANGSRLSILHSIDFGDGVHQRLGLWTGIENRVILGMGAV